MNDAGTLRMDARPGVVRFSVRVVPRASRDAVVGVHDGALKVALTAPPVEGEANAALVAMIARRLGVARRDVTLVHGDASRSKTLEVRGVDADAIRALVQGG